MKKIMMFIIFVTMCMSLCSCKESNRNLTDDSDKIISLEMQISITKAAIDLSDSNAYIIQSLEASNIEDLITYFSKSLDLVKDAHEGVSNTISSPNFILDSLEELIENYERTIILLEKLPDISNEEHIELTKLVLDGTKQHCFLIKYVQCFVNLYYIRNFDQLSDAEAKKTMEETWWEFGFEDDIKYNKNIQKQDLYLIWATQFFGDFDEVQFFQKLQQLRENDDLSSKDYNQKWAEFIENFIRDTGEWSSDATPFLYITLFKYIFLLFCTLLVYIKKER